MSKKQPNTQQASTTDQLDRWVFYGFLAILVTLPLALSRITFDQFDIAKILSLRFITAGMISLWIIKMIQSRKLEIRWSKLDFAVLAFLVLVFISTLTSVHFPTAFHGKFKRYEGFLTFLNYGILYFLALQTFTDFKKISTISKTITLAGGIVSLYGVMQYMGLDPLPWATLPFEERRSFSTFGNPDLLAGFLVLLVPFATAEFLKARDAKDNALMGASLFLTLLCLLTAFTRSGWVGSAVALIVFAVIGGKAIIANPRKIMFIAAAFIGIFAMIAVYSASTGHDVMNLVERLKSLTQITEGSAGTRIEIWKAGLKMIEAKPIFGWGPDTYRLSSEKFETYEYVKMNQGTTVADNAHNYIVQLAAGVGIPATVIFLLFFFAVIAIAIKYSRSLEGDDRLTYAAFISAAVGYAIHLLFGVSISGSTGVFWVVLAAMVAIAPLVKTKEIVPQSTYATGIQVAMVVFGIVSIISAYFALSMYMGDRSYAQAVQLSNNGNYDAAAASYENAIKLYKNGRYYDGYGMFLERLGMAQENRDLINRASQIYQEGKDWEPLEGDHYVFLAGAQAKLAAGPTDPILEDAVNILKEGIRVRPNGYSSRFLLANILSFQQKHEEAVPLLKFVLDINPAETGAKQLSESVYEALAKSYEEAGDKKQAKTYYEELLAVNPSHEAAKGAIKRLSAK